MGRYKACWVRILKVSEKRSTNETEEGAAETNGQCRALSFLHMFLLSSDSLEPYVSTDLSRLTSELGKNLLLNNPNDYEKVLKKPD